MNNPVSTTLNSSTPVLFADGTDFFRSLSKDYITHNVGYFILAPSGAGKTHFVRGQKKRDWIDGDYLWVATGADTTGDEWISDFSIVQEMNNRSDVITEQAKKQGLWVIGSSNSYLRPDAIVLPHWKTHVKYIRYRQLNNFDGGAKEEDLEGVLQHRRWIALWKKQGVPCFGSIQEAADFLSAKDQVSSTRKAAD